MNITQIICQILRLGSTEKEGATMQDTVLVRVRTDSGLEGLGEANAHPEVVKAIIDAPRSRDGACGLRALLVGENPLEIERLWWKMRHGTKSLGRTSIAIAAMSAVDLALWDLKGKHLNEPIHRLLGGKLHDQLPAYASAPFGQNTAETQMIGRRWVKAGYSAVKFSWLPVDPNQVLDLDLVRSARSGLGDQAALLIEAGGLWDTRTALRQAQRFAEFSTGWLEAPLRNGDATSYAWLHDHSPVPIAAGKAECGREAFQPLIDRRALDIYQVDLCRCGFTDGAYIRARVEEIGARVGNHCHPSPIALAAGLHWLSTCHMAALFEDCVDDSPLRHELAHERFEAENGMFTVPDGPGLGVTLNDDFIQENLASQSGD